MPYLSFTSGFGRLVPMIACFFMLFMTMESKATIYTFSGNGNWTNSANWTPSYPGLVISSGSEVIIMGTCQILPSHLIINNGTITNLNSGLIHNVGSITNGGTIHNVGSITNGGTIDNGGSITNGGTIDNGGVIANYITGSITNYSIFTNNGTVVNNGIIIINESITNNGTVTNNGSIDNNRTINNGGSIANNGTITNNIGGTISNNIGGTIGNGGTIDDNWIIDNDGIITNFSGGTITIGNGGTFFNVGTFYNVGIVDNSGEIYTGGTIDNGGTIYNLGLIYSSGTIDNSGTIENDWEIDSSGTIDNSGTIENDWEIVSSGTIDNGGIITNNYNIQNNSGTIDNSGTLINNYSIQNYFGTFINSGTFTNGSIWIINNYGTITNYITGSISNGGTIINFNNRIIENNGTFFNGGTFSNTGIITNGNSGIITNDIVGTILNNRSIENNGTINGNGTINNVSNNITFSNTGSIAPGTSPGNLTIFGLLNLGEGTYICDINGIVQTTNYDLLTVSGNVVLSNASLVVNWGSFVPSLGQTFTVMTFGSRTGVFQSVVIPSVAGLNFTTNYTATSVTISAQSLPVELVSLKASVENEFVQLLWRTASETNNEGFYIQRSSDGKIWTDLGFVKGYGDFRKEQTYSWTDERPISGFNYYRLKQMDYDGFYEYSNIVSVKMKNSNSKLQFKTNPAEENVTIVIDTDYSGNASLVVFDFAGKQMIVKDLVLEGDAFRTDIGLSGLSIGIYVVQVQAGKEVWRERLVVH